MASATAVGGPEWAALLRRGNDPLLRTQGEDPVALADGDHAVDVLVFGELLFQQLVPEPPEFVAVEIVDEPADQFGRRMVSRPHAIRPERDQDVLVVSVDWTIRRQRHL